MPRMLSVYSENVLDLGDLARRYCDIADIYLQGPYLGVQNNSGLSFRIDTSNAGEAELEDYYVQHVMRVRALIDRPIEALIEYNNSQSINLALSRMPAADVFVANQYRVLFSLEEIQRRLQAGEDWEFVGEEFL